jgi:hypothetical protein
MAAPHTENNPWVRSAFESIDREQGFKGLEAPSLALCNGWTVQRRRIWGMRRRHRRGAFLDNDKNASLEAGTLPAAPMGRRVDSKQKAIIHDARCITRGLRLGKTGRCAAKENISLLLTEPREILPERHAVGIVLSAAEVSPRSLDLEFDRTVYHFVMLRPVSLEGEEARLLLLCMNPRA